MAPIKRLPRLPVLKSEVPLYPKPKDCPKVKLGAYKTHLDGREVCYNTAAGRLEYRMRTFAMADRQYWLCKAPDCEFRRMGVANVTFQHGKTRGLGGGLRDDRINQPGNEAWHYLCNAKRGSQRTV